MAKFTILPKLHYTTYMQDGNRFFCIWKQWLGHCHDVLSFKI